MHVRQMRKSDEDWLLAELDKQDFDDSAFRSRDYVLAIQSDEKQSKCGFGRVYEHTDENGASYAQFTNVGTLDEYDSEHIRSNIFEALFRKARDYDCKVAYVIADSEPDVPFEFEECTREDLPVSLNTENATDSDTVFKSDVRGALDEQTEEERLNELAEEFGYDDDTTTKYSTD